MILNFTVEDYVLGCLLNNPEYRDKLLVIPEDAWTVPEYREIFRVMRDMYFKKPNFQVVDILPMFPPTVQDTIGFLSFETIVTVFFNEYFEEFMNRYKRRKAREICEKFIMNDGDVDSLIAELDTVRNYQAYNVTSLDMDKLLVAYYDHIEKLYMSGGRIAGVPTGYPKLDELINGLQKGTMTVLAARPSMGKTTLAVNIATNAIRDGYSVLYIDTEMPPFAIMNKIMARGGVATYEDLSKGRLTDEQWKKFIAGFNWLKGKKFFLRSHNLTPRITVYDVLSEIRKIKAQHKIDLDLVIVDYLQNLEVDSHYRSRYEEVSAISRTLSNIARTENVAMLAVAQLSRSVENREDKRPILADLRDSGQIEQDAHVIMFLYRDSHYWSKEEREKRKNDPEANMAELIVAKNRDNQLDTIMLYWEPEKQVFVEAKEQ